MAGEMGCGPGPRLETRFPKAGVRTHPCPTGRSSVNPAAHSEDQQLLEALCRSRDYYPGASVPSERDSQPDQRAEFSEARPPGTYISQLMSPECSLRPDE